ncbi:MAG: DciA family protein [Arthrobacter sp.]|nr:DciA family protein [Arthrobacter sp.]
MNEPREWIPTPDPVTEDGGEPEADFARPENLPGEVTLDEADAPKVALQRARNAAQERGEVRRGAAQVARAREKAAARKAAARGERPAGVAKDDEGRDPVGLGRVISSLVRSRGWSDPVAVGSVLTRWAEIVGPDIAAHTEPESFENTIVVVRCDSTSWATQLRLMQHTVLKRFDATVGAGVVTTLKVLGPAGPSWKHGLRTAQGGRGPRDTYG